MTGNPKTSKWWGGGPRADRKRKKIEITLSDEARARLELLAGKGRRSELIERLIMAAPLPDK